MVVAEEEEVEPDIQVKEAEAVTRVETTMEISLDALTGNVTEDTIRILGTIKKTDVSILIDTGSTHNFLGSEVAARISCNVTPTVNLLVTTANGDRTRSSGIFSNLKWTMQGHCFAGNLRLLPLGRCDMVLGDDWLCKLGDIIFNLEKLYKHVKPITEFIRYSN
ncbi:hypothetical protein MKX01_018139 [Papaver californicum]|nr:hypothetical protein MKX01_018139 [Papaver californicum]